MSPPDTTTPRRLTQTAALLLTTLSAGVNLSLSTFLVPRLLESPTPTMLQQWRRTYARGASTIPFAAAAAAAGYLWLGLSGGCGGGGGGAGMGLCRARLYLAAAGLTVGIAPYTMVVMGGVNGRLKGLEKRVGEVRSEGEVAIEERSAKGLVDWWGVLNLGRAGLLVAGAVCGLAATL
ncbi:uncharacterized protein B0H64DRAFT_437289 [Chaetomium fimeti]|uniref:DUF1772 domain-containing protein n=1 Tax=Chaetomium fimeti TaxID=1854472 RepID=A0AAE0HP40_9PEZI|nr:hypothetical protein B0H64DRAFT_437289 [Chaetomium fimeti]